MYNKQVTLDLNSLERVHEFVRLATPYPNDIAVSDGRYLVDGKSILGVLSLDLNNKVIVHIKGAAIPEVENFTARLNRELNVEVECV